MSRRVLVVGAGIAGASAAAAAAGRGAEVVVIAAGHPLDSATAAAQGGVAAAVGVADAAGLHGADTLIAAAGLGDPAAVHVLVTEGAARVTALLDAGFPADRTAAGDLALGLEAAHTRHRIVHAGGDRTGAALASWHLDALVSAGVELRPWTRLVELIVRNGVVTGAIVADARSAGAIDAGLSAIDADAVVIATGGIGRLYPTTSNPHGATGDGLLAAWDAGAQLADLEFVQFHPTTLPFAGGFLVSEAVRGAGAVLIDDDGRRFLLDDDPRGELAPRDVVAAGVWRRMMAQGGRPVRLDATVIARRDGADALRRRFPAIDGALRAQGIDWTREPVPVAPAAHFAMGGIRTDLLGRSSVPGLLAAGECARSGVHGANRLASNSLLEGMVFGARAGRAAADGAAGDGADARSWHAAPVDAPLRAAGAPAAPASASAPPLPLTPSPTIDDVRRRIGAGIGIERDAAGLDAAIAALEGIVADPRADRATHEAARLGRIIAIAALRREESRGAHRRRDAPATDPRQARPRGLVRGANAAAATRPTTRRQEPVC